MKTIVFIGTNKSGSSYEAFELSESMGYHTVLLTNREMFVSKRQEFPHVHCMQLCDIKNMNEIRKIIYALIRRGLDIHAIISFIDPYCYTASVLSRELGLKYFSGDAILIMLDKIKSREILDGSPYTPLFCIINGNQAIPDEMAAKPLVLKNPTSTGSRDVYKVQAGRKYEKVYHNIRKQYPGEPVLAEEYLEGPQYLIETVTINHKVNIVAILKQHVTFTGRFIITGYQMVYEHESDRSLKEAVHFIVGRFGMKDGPCHLEIRHVNNEWKLIEVNPRIAGGAINEFIEMACGVNLIKETIKFALGLEPDFEYKYKKESYLQYMIVPRASVLLKVTGKNTALNCPGVEQVYIRPKKGSIIMPPVSMGYRYAYVIATGESADEAADNARYAASRIKFHIREIYSDVFTGRSQAEKKILDIAYEYKRDLDKIDDFFNNYILYH